MSEDTLIMRLRTLPLTGFELDDLCEEAAARITSLEAELAKRGRHAQALANAGNRIAELEAEVTRRLDEVGAGIARRVAEERADIIECIRSTTWSGTEEIVAMIRKRSDPFNLSA